MQFLKSDDFLNGISIMLPFDQWVQLKETINYNDAGTLAIARLLIDNAVAGELDKITPDEFIELFNKQFGINFWVQNKLFYGLPGH